MLNMHRGLMLIVLTHTHGWEDINIAWFIHSAHFSWLCISVQSCSYVIHSWLTKLVARACSHWNAHGEFAGSAHYYWIVAHNYYMKFFSNWFSHRLKQHPNTSYAVLDLSIFLHKCTKQSLMQLKTTLHCGDRLSCMEGRIRLWSRSPSHIPPCLEWDCWPVQLHALLALCHLHILQMKTHKQ